MEFDDFLEPEVVIAVAVTAALATPPVRRVLRQGLVYGLAGALIAGDRISSMAQSARERVGRAREEHEEVPERSSPRAVTT